MKRRHDMPFGAYVKEDYSVRFSLWAPSAADVTLCLHENNRQYDLPMQRNAEGWCTLETDAATVGTLYSYRIDGKHQVPDPASRFQPHDAHGPSQVVDPTATDWTDGSWHGRPWEEAIIYELHLGTFTEAGNFHGAEDRLDYLAELGITAIELMPLSDFPNGRNWGYDGVLPFAPDSSYGTPQELKKFIQAAHEREIMVLLDVVYNHFGPDGNYLHLYAPDFFTERYHTPWGAAVNFDGENSTVPRRFFIDNALYWLEEFHFDGLRLDAVDTIYDESKPDFLEELAYSVKEGPGRDRMVHLILENDDNAVRYLQRTDEGAPQQYTSQWNDDFHHCLHSLLTGETDGYYVDYKEKPAWYLGRCLAEGFAWQGEPSPYRDGKHRGAPSAELPPTAFVSFLQNHDQVGNRALGERIDQLVGPEAMAASAVIRFLAPSPTLLFMGEEFAADTPFRYFCDFPGELGKAVTEGRRAEFSRFEYFSSETDSEAIPDPNVLETFLSSKLNWDSLKHPEHSKRLRLYHELISLRKEAVIPGLAGPFEQNGHFEFFEPTTIQVTWSLADDSRLRMLINLAGESCRITKRPDCSKLIYCLPHALPESLAREEMPPWAVGVFLHPGANTTGSRRSTIAALHVAAEQRCGWDGLSREPGLDQCTSDRAFGPTAPVVPDATYRVQLQRDFNFEHLSEILSYLDALGISHCYCSPYLKARPGSSHGYDIVDHREINPELGSRSEYEGFIDGLRQRGMGHILDVVPNHMGVMGNDNHWWLDMLENGPASRYGHFFDIDWNPLESRAKNQVLLPVLGDHYGNVLDDGQLTLSFDAHSGSFSVNYYEHVFPIDPQSYPFILTRNLEFLEKRFRSDDQRILNFQSLMTALDNLPSRNTCSEEERSARDRDKELFKQNLVRLYEESSDIADHIHECVLEFNEGGDKLNTELLHQLLERQAYRLAYWRVASDEINYRRFFDINDLACLRMEESRVFEDTHELILSLVSEGKIQGLRIDHPDGLYDPAGYFQRLQASASVSGRSAVRATDRSVYVVAEKILTGDECLRPEWPIHGTTGYDFAALCTGLFVESANAEVMQHIYERFIGHKSHLADICYHARKLIMETSLASEIRVLANQLNRISEVDPHTRDYTLNGLRQALTEVIACFPVYRTYVTDAGPSEEDKRSIEQAIAEGAHRSHAADVTAFDFIRDVLLWRVLNGEGEAFRQKVVRFSLQFQQYTAPVMAKGIEDTSLYIYNRLIALNDVGFDPGCFGVSLRKFHEANKQRLAQWPHTLTSISTHDSKRLGDVRARICVLSEIPERWRQGVSYWAGINEPFKTRRGAKLWPDSNIEYLFYQTLVGAWPVAGLEEVNLEAFKSRIQAYMLKAAKEAKQYTSWVNSNTAYEDNLQAFVDGVLGRENKAFLQDFLSFQNRVSQLGFINSLAQTLLELTVPGVPDIYQGDELWNFSLVDPDNRRPVDYSHRRHLLEGLEAATAHGAQLPELIADLIRNMGDGRVKAYVTWRSLIFRREHRDLFQGGDYVPLKVGGSRGANVCAFARMQGGGAIIVLVPRLLGGQVDINRFSPGVVINPNFWADTFVELPDRLAVGGLGYQQLFTHQYIEPTQEADGWRLAVADALGQFPVALLTAQG